MLCLYRYQCLVTLMLTVGGLSLNGCGTTRSTDTNRTATEQLLISDAIDRAVQTINLQTLAGQSVFLDDSRLGEAVDRNYLASTLRQHLLASGCALRAERDQADFVVEARAGAIGTDRNDLLFGVPSMNVPQILPVQPVPAAIPEVPIAKRRDQRGIAKIAVFAYHRQSGTPVWQSGVAHQESSANDVWILGAGPFQRGTIYEGTTFAGKTLRADDPKEDERLGRHPQADLARARTFTTPQQLAKRAAPTPSVDGGVVQAVHQEPLSAASTPMSESSEPNPTQSSEAAVESPEVRQLLPVAATGAQPGGGGFSAQVHESQISRTTGSLTPSPFPRPVDPVPLPQPRFNSP